MFSNSGSNTKVVSKNPARNCSDSKSMRNWASKIDGAMPMVLILRSYLIRSKPSSFLKNSIFFIDSTSLSFVIFNPLSITSWLINSDSISFSIVWFFINVSSSKESESPKTDCICFLNCENDR